MKMGWEKVLYKDQGVADNYTDDTFLDEMKKNVNTRMYKIKDVIFESGIVSQQVAIICIFVSLFIYMDNGVVGPTYVLLLGLIFLVIGVIIQYLVTRKTISWIQYVKVAGFVFALSPILKTLTKTISTDTIYAMSTGMLLINLLFHDYGTGNPGVSKVISLNASIFAAVCLASRLPSFWHVYAYVIIAIEMFALFSEFRQVIKSWHRKAYILLTESLVVVATLMLIPIHLTAAFSLVTSHFAITFLFPAWMVRLQRMKNNIHGPWDEAMIKK